MDHTDAVQFIRAGIPARAQVSAWADFGCGRGIFTKALAGLLANGSTISAIDKEYHRIVSPNPHVSIQFIESDFGDDLPQLINLDGILMANALHYVRDQQRFLKTLRQRLKPSGRLILVEYDTDQSNPWVPYPVPYKKLTDVLPHEGFTAIQKIGERASVYNQDRMYACVALT